jgi:hypothetical protein
LSGQVVGQEDSSVRVKEIGPVLALPERAMKWERGSFMGMMGCVG